MSEMSGYTCDGGCEATTVVERGDDLGRQRWFTLFGPRGFIPMHACSAQCMVKAIARFVRP